MSRVVLAYSGGLDTTVAVAWLKETFGHEVVAVAMDVGQAGDLDEIAKRGIAAGAVDAVVVDAVDEFADEFVLPALQANALYQNKYPLVSALSRPLISKHLVTAARESGATSVAHGCTGKGNDQLRFEVSLGAIAPDLEVLAPIRDWGLSRDQAISYGQERGLPITAERSSPYSIDENLWGRTVECGVLEDPFVEPPPDVWTRTADPASAPREPAYLDIGFEEGVPVSLDRETLGLRELITKVGELAGARGFGRVDMIEDRVVGIKSREIYEVPAALALIAAHVDLEELTLDASLLREKRRLESGFADLLYQGGWFSPLREAMTSFFDSSAPWVTGSVRIRFDAGSARVVGRSSDGSLYRPDLATYDEGDAFDHKAAEGFVKLYGLALRTWARRREK